VSLRLLSGVGNGDVQAIPTFFQVLLLGVILIFPSLIAIFATSIFGAFTRAG
jgi:hypothetical protein